MPIDKTLSNLVINKIPTQEIYNKLKERNLINEDELYLVEEDSGSPDWNQNDETAPDYIKNRTHYVNTDGTVVPLDEKFIPDTIARTSTATVGQTIVVKSVDENGVPTKWEAADMPEKVQSYTATIGTTWGEDSETGVKYQVVSVPALTGADDEKAFVDHTDSSINGTSDGYALFVEEENQYLEFITNGRAETVEGGIRFEIFGDANTIEIPIEVRVG